MFVYDISKILGYNIIRADHQSNTKRGEVCIYYKNTQPLKLINTKYYQEYISFKIVRRDCFKFICLYQSPSQMNDEIESFLENFVLALDKIHEENPFMISVLDDFNIKSNN